MAQAVIVQCRRGSKLSLCKQAVPDRKLLSEPACLPGTAGPGCRLVRIQRITGGLFCPWTGHQPRKQSVVTKGLLLCLLALCQLLAIVRKHIIEKSQKNPEPGGCDDESPAPECGNGSWMRRCPPAVKDETFCRRRARAQQLSGCAGAARRARLQTSAPGRNQRRQRRSRSH